MKTNASGAGKKSKVSSGLDNGLQFAELLPSAHIADHHFFHSASLQTEQSLFQTPGSQQVLSYCAGPFRRDLLRPDANTGSSQRAWIKLHC